jgi:hypothetical protein
VRDSDPRPVWPEYYVAEGNGQIAIGNRKLLPERGRDIDAGQEKSGAPRFAVFQTNGQVTGRSLQQIWRDRTNSANR